MWATALFLHINDVDPAGAEIPLDPADDLKSYQDTLRQAIMTRNGHIHHLSRDTLVALFGVPAPVADHAQRGVDAAVMLMDELAEVNENRLAQGRAMYRVGIGVNTGYLRLDDARSTPLRLPAGDSIANAQELSALNKQTPFYTIFISEDTLAEMSRMNGYHVDNLGKVDLCDEADPTTVYALMHADALQLA